VARSAGAGAVLDQVTRHPGLRELPLASTTLLLRAIGAMRELDQPVLRYGSRVPDMDSLARVLNVEPGEFALLLPGLLERDLLRQDAGGALYSPLLLEVEERRQAQAERRRAVEEASAQGGEEPVSPRALASRMNGSRGGRPSSRAPVGQRQMPLMQVVASADGNPTGYATTNLTGSFSETQRVLSPTLALAETQTQSEEEQRVPSSSGRASAGDDGTRENPTAKPEPKPEVQTQLGQAVDVTVLARELRVIARLPAEPTKADLSTVRSWLIDGHSPATMRDVVRAGAADTKGPIGHLGYFKQAMAAARVMQVVQGGGSAPGLDSLPAAAPAPDRRLQPRQAEESEAAYLRRTKGLRPLVAPAREPQEDAETYGRRLRARFDIEVTTAQAYGAPAPVWEEYAAGAQLAA